MGKKEQNTRPAEATKPPAPPPPVSCSYSPLVDVVMYIQGFHQRVRVPRPFTGEHIRSRGVEYRVNKIILRNAGDIIEAYVLPAGHGMSLTAEVLLDLGWEKDGVTP
jgi:hypothetical protein